MPQSQHHETQNLNTLTGNYSRLVLHLYNGGDVERNKCTQVALRGLRFLFF